MLSPVVFSDEVKLNVDVRMLFISLMWLSSANTVFFSLEIAVSYLKCSRILFVCFHLGWYDACREKTDRRNKVVLKGR